MARGAWGVDIRSLDTSERIFALEPDRLMMPASNMKIITVAAAAEILGWDHRFTTTLETSAPVEAGVLRGDLFVRSNGDPTINSRDGRASAILAEWTSALRAAGIQEIDGRIVGDDRPDGRGTTCSSATPRRLVRWSSTRIWRPSSLNLGRWLAIQRTCASQPESV